MNILLGVTGSIAAYKAASVASVLHDKGHSVRVCMTKAATQFVGPVTFSALTHNPVILDEDEFKPDGHILHIEVAQQWAGAVVIAPASFDFISKVTSNRADDALSSICAAWQGTVLLCPAMNTVMFDNLGLGNNPNCVVVDSKFKRALYGKTVRFTALMPATGKLACGMTGLGAMRPTKDIVEFIEGSDSD